MEVIRHNPFKGTAWQVILKVIVSVIFIYLLYRQVFAKEDISTVWETLRLSIHNKAVYYLLVVFLLMPCNWIIETIKWKQLVSLNFKITFRRAFKAIFSGVLFSMFTPNRIGQYAGRLWHVLPSQSLQAIYATLIGSFAQNLSHLIIGLFGIAIIINYANTDLNWINDSLFIWVLVISIISIFIYFNINWIVEMIKSITWIKNQRYLQKLQWSFPIPRQLLGSTLFYSWARLIIFGGQYFLIILMIGIIIDPWIIAACIATIFLFQTFIPLPPVIGFLARGEIALLVWSPFEIDPTLILASTYTLWLINIVLPSILGLFFFIMTKYRKTNKGAQ